MNFSCPTNSEGAIPPREWLRVPEAVAWSGLSKPKLYQLINAGLVKTAEVRQRGQVRGSRLIGFDSLRDYLNSLATGGEAEEPAAEGGDAEESAAEVSPPQVH